MTDPTPDPTDVELVRNAWRNAPCPTCRRQRACRCIVEDHDLRDYRARAVLSALAAAGRLRQEDDMSKEIRVELNGPSHVTKMRETMPDNEKRVVVIKPGDVLLIGGVRFGDAYQAAETMDRFKELTGITPVVLFAGDIQLGQLTTDELRELLARAEANTCGGVFCVGAGEFDAALDAIPPADAEEEP